MWIILHVLLFRTYFASIPALLVVDNDLKYHEIENSESVPTTVYGVFFFYVVVLLFVIYFFFFKEKLKIMKEDTLLSSIITSLPGEKL